MDSPEQRFDQVLRENARGGVTLTEPGNYPHVWPNDKAYTAISVSHEDPIRAAMDMVEAFGGQWSNGMVPHQTYNPGIPLHKSPDKHFWQTKKLAQSPNNVYTSGVASLPVLAEGCYAAMQHLDGDDRKAFLADVVPRLTAYHEWLYRERDFGGEGLITAIHPYETSVNGIAYWGEYMAEHPSWKAAKLFGKLPLEKIVAINRKDKTGDTGKVSISMKAGTLAVAAIFPLGRTGYDTAKLKDEWPWQIEDVLLNSILVRNNDLLVQLATEAGIKLSDELIANMQRTREALEKLYIPAEQGESYGHYFSRERASQEHLRIVTIASLMPAYSGAITNDRLDEITRQLKDPQTFGTQYPIPTAPANSPYFDSEKEDIGAIKPPLNWLIAKGFIEADRKNTVRDILMKTYEMTDPERGGLSKAYSSITGKPLDQNKDSAVASISRDAIRLTTAQIIMLSTAFKTWRNRNKKAA